jgi:hypothetical protein
LTNPREYSFALERLSQVWPQWVDVRTARETVGLPDRHLLHAGPPYVDPTRPPAPVLASAILCSLYEGWAHDIVEAEKQIAAGRIRLVPAQSYGVVTPLAAVISPRTALVEVADTSAQDSAPRRAWSLLSSGAGPQLRFGSLDLAILERMHWRDEILAPRLQRALWGAPIDLTQIAGVGIAGGDDLHARTSAATESLYQVLLARAESRKAAEGDVAAMLRRSPLFFLTLWMAACHLALTAMASEPSQPSQPSEPSDPSEYPSTFVLALAGNGIDCGIRVAGDPERWFTAPAPIPRGPKMDPVSHAATSPMVGDSGMIDAAGLGIHALREEGEVVDMLRHWLPSDRKVMTRKQLALAPVGESGHTWAALDADAVVDSDLAPHALVAMLAADGRQGLLGRGVVEFPLAAFRAACNTVRGSRSFPSRDSALTRI